LGAALLSMAAGCSTVNDFTNRLFHSDQPQQVTPDEFMQRQSKSDTSETLNGDKAMPVAPAAAATTANPPTRVDPGIERVVERSETRPATEPSAEAPATLPVEPTVASGQFLSLGGVVAEVNGTPIYINSVLRLVWPTLRNDAKTMDADHFQQAAADEISRQISALEENELLYAAAVRSLDDSDRRLVDDLTTAYRQRLVTQAGGSLEVARRNAAASGDDFEELIRNQHRSYMISLYQQRKFVPLIEPSAEDLRLYYRQNVEKLFTDHAEATFDLIKIDPAALGGDTPLANRKLAFEKAKQVHDRAAAGESFATLFAEFNNDPGLAALTNGTGSVGKIQRGSFGLKEIEDAVWKLQPGEVTDVMEIDGVLYVARLESRSEGRVRRFEDEAVQRQISATVRNQRMSQRLDEERLNLLRQSIREINPQMFQTAVDMAMQSYQTWNKK
jgi:parvulin-like peptidyl-prolyl isomerase